MKHIISDYIDTAMKNAVFQILEDGTFAGRITLCPGVISFASARKECEEELQSVLEDWLLSGLRLNHTLPVIEGINLNVELHNGSMASL